MSRNSAGGELTQAQIHAIRSEFPVLHQQVNGHDLVYLDSASSCQKPRAVVDAMAQFYLRDYANVHRGVHRLSERATTRYEAARDTVARFLGAERSSEVVFVRGATEAINLVAQSFLRPRLRPGDRILISELEHHANIVPWQLICEQSGAELSAVPVSESGFLDLDQFVSMMDERVRFVSICQIANATGAVLPLTPILQAARERCIPVLVDGAQGAAHYPLDVKQLGCDFYTFSGHKLYGPTGIGVLWAKSEHLQGMPPFMGGGDMIRRVRIERSEFADPPARFEAGTPPIAQAIGLAKAIEFLENIGLDRIKAHETALYAELVARAGHCAHLRDVGNAMERSAIFSFLLDGIHAHDVGTLLDSQGVAVRVGHHCAMPLMERLGVPATVRVSLAIYNTHSDICRLFEAIDYVKRVFQ